MNKNDVALAIAKKLKRVNDDLSIILKSWKGMPGSANEPSTFDQAVVCIAADGQSQHQRDADSGEWQAHAVQSCIDDTQRNVPG